MSLHPRWTLALALLLGSCATTVTQTTYTIQQQGLAPGMSAPLLGGPGARAGHGFLIGGAQAGAAVPGTTTDNGAVASVIADDGGRVGGGYSGGWWELAGAFELRPGNWAHSGAADISNSYRSTTLLYPTFAVRFLPMRSAHFQLGITQELSIAIVPYARTVTSVTESTTDWPNSPPTSSQSTATSSQTGQAGMVIWRAGLTMSFISGPFALSMGVLMVTQPYFTGTQTVSQSCVNFSCSGETPDDVAVVDYAFGLVPYLAPSLALGDSARISLQLFGNISSNMQLSQVSPVGGELMLRSEF